MNKTMKVGILLYNEVEVLDFSGPFEVFSITTYKDSKDKPFEVSTVAETDNVIKARNGLRILPDYSFANSPMFDILIIPGGYGAEEIEIHNKEMINWITAQSKNVKILASVCTGAFLLATARLLDGKKATTHWLDIERFEKEFENVEVLRDVKYVDQGNIITSAGISAGINMSFHIIERVLGAEIARETARRMEYDILIDLNNVQEGNYMREIKRSDINEEWAHSGIVEAGDFVFVSYCVGNIGQPIENQINGAFDHLTARLESIGLTLESVVKMDCLFRDVWNIPVMEKVIKERFKGKYPARKSIQTEFAHHGGQDGLQFQLDAIAFRG